MKMHRLLWLLACVATLASCRGKQQPASQGDVASVRVDLPAAAAGDSARAALAGTPSAPSATVPATSAPSAVGRDSLRGIVQRVGNEPRTAVTVRGIDGTECVLQMPPPAPPIEGLEVTLWGARSNAPTLMPRIACTLTVGRYAVRAVDGVAAVDGILLESETSYALELASGYRPLLSNVPPTLRTQVGARIFWAGPLNRAPVAYGVLAAPK